MTFRDPTKAFAQHLLDGQNEVQFELLERLQSAEVDLVPHFLKELIILSYLHENEHVRSLAERIIEEGKVDGIDPKSHEVFCLLQSQELVPFSIAEPESITLELGLHETLSRSQVFSDYLIDWSNSNINNPVLSHFIRDSANLVLRNFPQNIEAYHLLGVLYQEHIKNLAEAKNYFEGALKIDQEHLPSLQRLVDIAQAEKDPQKVIEHLEVLITLDPQNASNYGQLAVALMKGNDQSERPAQLMEIAIGLEPENCQLIVAYGKMLWQELGDPKSAIKYLEDHLNAIPEAQSGPLFKTLGDLYLIHLKNHQKAKEFYLEAMQLDPGNFERLTEVNQLLVERFSDPGTAKSLFESFFSLNQSHAPAHAAYARFLKNFTQEKELIKVHVHKAINLDVSYAYLVELL